MVVWRVEVPRVLKALSMPVIQVLAQMTKPYSSSDQPWELGTLTADSTSHSGQLGEGLSLSLPDIKGHPEHLGSSRAATADPWGHSFSRSVLGSTLYSAFLFSAVSGAPSNDTRNVTRDTSSQHLEEGCWSNSR